MKISIEKINEAIRALGSATAYHKFAGNSPRIIVFFPEPTITKSYMPPYDAMKGKQVAVWPDPYADTWIIEI